MKQYLFLTTILFLSFKPLISKDNRNTIYPDMEKYQEFNQSQFRDMYLEFDFELQNQIDLLRRNNLRDAYSYNEFYSPLFLKKIIEQDIPYEFRYIPIIESGMKHRAKSHAKASGLWQIMPSTGTWLGLKKTDCVNNYYDPLASTHYATKMLGSLYDGLKDWNLVLCAYNYGIGNLNKVMKKVGSRNFQDFKHKLPKETRDYVYRLHAAAYLDYIDHYKKMPLDISYSDVLMVRVEENTPTSYFRDRYEMFDFLNPQITCDYVGKHDYIYIIE